jgi:TRAP transporter 4TM/12TM fusion protein
MHPAKSLANVLAGLFGLFSLFVVSGLPVLLDIPLDTSLYRAASLTILIAIIYLGLVFRDGEGQAGVAWHFIPLGVAGIVGAGYVALHYDDRIVQYSVYGYLDTVGILLALALAVSLLVCLVRMIGWVLPVFIVLIMSATYWQQHLPGALRGGGFSLERLTYAIYVGGNGIFGVPFGIATTIIIVFLIFGQLLQRSGGGQWLMDVATSVSGRTSGGPAKAAVVSSASFGMISGSPSGNVGTSGPMTIPMMMRTGFTPSSAGAVEAAASTGGMILPPVMGAVAFIMADFLGLPYSHVIAAALIPALMYFSILMFSVHFRARRLNLVGLPAHEIPAFRKAFMSGWRHLIPLGVLIYLLLVKGLPPELAGVGAVVTVLFSSFLTQDRSLWLTPPVIWQSLIGAVRSWTIVGAVTASVGMLLGTLTLSGLGVKVASFISDLSGGNIYLALLLVGIASLILGMGLDMVPLYLTLVVLTAPALVMAGLTPVQAHLYVIYWGLASFLTPPVCNAVFVACAISGAKIWRTGGEAMLLGAGVFFVPVAFALNPALILNGGEPAGEIALGVAFAMVAVVLLSAGFQGYFFWRMDPVERALVAIAGLLFLVHGIKSAAVGAVLLVITYLWWRFGRPRRQDGQQDNAGNEIESAASDGRGESPPDAIEHADSIRRA